MPVIGNKVCDIRSEQVRYVDKFSEVESAFAALILRHEALGFLQFFGHLVLRESATLTFSDQHLAKSIVSNRVQGPDLKNPKTRNFQTGSVSLVREITERMFQYHNTSGSLTGTTYGGTVSVDTSKQSVQVTNLRFGYLASSSVGQATFNMNGSSTYNSTLRIPLVSLTGSCTGGSCGAGIASNGAFAGRFIGAAGEGIGAVYGAVTNNNAIGGTAAGVFKR